MHCSKKIKKKKKKKKKKKNNDNNMEMQFHASVAQLSIIFLCFFNLNWVHRVQQITPQPKPDEERLYEVDS